MEAETVDVRLRGVPERLHKWLKVAGVELGVPLNTLLLDILADAALLKHYPLGTAETFRKPLPDDQEYEQLKAKKQKRGRK